MFVASLIGNSLTILLGIAMLGMAMKGFSPAGMPLTSDWRLTGRTGQCVGFIVGLCGVLSIFAGGSLLVLRAYSGYSAEGRDGLSTPRGQANLHHAFLLRKVPH